MGYNVDFIYLIGCPEKIKCPECKKLISSQLEELDIDCGVDKDNNTYKTYITCENCDYEIPIRIEITSKTFVDNKEFKQNENKCKECGEIMDSDEEIEFGQCNKCSAWKYRQNSK